MITAKLTVLGKKYTSEGATLDEALRGLKPGGVAMKGILEVDNGTSKRERILAHGMLKRLFHLSPTMREMALKQVTLLFS